MKEHTICFKIWQHKYMQNKLEQGKLLVIVNSHYYSNEITVAIQWKRYEENIHNLI